jgi:hypothetical protein
MKVLVILVCFFWGGLWGESLNIEMLPTLRTQQYPLGSWRKIVVFSAPRTGSSLIYNTFRYLFEDQSNIFCFHNEFNLNRFVLKTHKFNELNLLKDFKVLFVVTIRNPINSIISNFRICPHKIENIRNFVENKIQMHKDYLRFYEKLKLSGNNVIFLKYEDFENNMECLFELIESHFKLQINEEDKHIVKRGYGKENVSLSIEGFSDFKEWLPISGFHGSHIMTDTYVPPEELIYWLNILIEKVKPEFKKYGYFLD